MDPVYLEAKSKADLALILGIVGLVTGLGIILCPIAWVMGKTAMDMSNGLQGRPGYLIGMIGTIVNIVGIIVPITICCFLGGMGSIFAGG